MTTRIRKTSSIMSEDLKVGELSDFISSLVREGATADTQLLVTIIEGVVTLSATVTIP